jgi:hypothetical protein
MKAAAKIYLQKLKDAAAYIKCFKILSRRKRIRTISWYWTRFSMIICCGCYAQWYWIDPTHGHLGVRRFNSSSNHFKEPSLWKRSLGRTLTVRRTQLCDQKRCENSHNRSPIYWIVENDVSPAIWKSSSKSQLHRSGCASPWRPLHIPCWACGCLCRIRKNFHHSARFTFVSSLWAAGFMSVRFVHSLVYGKTKHKN